MPENVFSRLSDDVILNIFFKLEEDPRHWPRLACVSTKFSALIWDVCCKSKCCKTMPSVVTDLLFDGGGAESAPPGGWAALYKLAVSCPGVLQAGVLLENSDFGLQRELGPEESFQRNQPPPEYSQQNQQPPPEYSQQNQQPPPGNSQQNQQPPPASFPRNQQPPPPPSSALPPPCLSGCGSSDVEWSLYDDLFYDTVYDASESGTAAGIAAEKEVAERDEAAAAAPPCKKRKVCRSLKPHLAKGVWNLSREQGNKLLASRFKGDCLYICDWPGCVHMEEKRNYMLFRGIFKNFKQSRVWRTINDGHRSKIEVNCAFCSCKETWDLHSAFCLRRYFGFHDDGEPVVRAYVCENGHVSGAWTDWPLYT